MKQQGRVAQFSSTNNLLGFRYSNISLVSCHRVDPVGRGESCQSCGIGESWGVCGSYGTVGRGELYFILKKLK